MSSMLYENGGAVERRDFCRQCAAAQAAKPLGLWQAQAAEEEKPMAKGALPVSVDAETLFRELYPPMAKDDEEVVYILALMLERKRRLVETECSRREDGAAVRIYAHRPTGEVFEVADPGISAGDLDGVQKRVLDLLQGRA